MDTFKIWTTQKQLKTNPYNTRGKQTRQMNDRGPSLTGAGIQIYLKPLDITFQFQCLCLFPKSSSRSLWENIKILSEVSSY